MTKVSIKTEYITLGQLLKLISIVQSGGEAKIYLAMNDILINGEIDNRRGRKIYPGDQVRIEEEDYLVQSNEIR